MKPTIKSVKLPFTKFTNSKKTNPHDTLIVTHEVLTDEMKRMIATNSYLGQKGYTIPKSILSSNELNVLYDELYLTPVIDTPISGTPPPIPIPVYKENSKKIYIPRFYGIKRYGLPDKSEIGNDVENINITFVKNLRDYQEKVVETYINSTNTPLCATSNGIVGGGGILSLYTGAGKTVCAIKIISIIQKKTIIIVHKEFLMNQWIERIREFTPDARIGRIQGRIFDIEDKDIVLAMMQTLYNEEKTFDLRSFGLCIVDEVHRIGSSQFHKCLFQIQPPFWLGISATVNRKDKMENLIQMFIGDIIYSIERKGDDFVSVRGIDYSTNDDEYSNVITNHRGEIAYSTMISKICGYEPRSDFIVKIIKDLIIENNKSQILLLSHIRLMLEYIYQKLTENGISVGFYVGGMKQCDLDETANTKQVVLSTYMMSSEALDIPSLSTLILASPKTDIIQCVGRILRKKHDSPIIVDIIDSHSTFQNQWTKRKEYYKKCNYKIQKTKGDLYLNTNNAMLQINSKPSVWKTLYTPNFLINTSSPDELPVEIGNGKCLLDLSTL
jgi:superfamily II DNA or RNA helicase